ncbi:hypothetical protein FOXG_18433 [Fusarium oxysporum f. sp. lycopersici 4287]|uniref:Uncharacterized protein n=3 Tax=Fusarium oxysporum TaxID=5507 RepID=W9I654_FUSOX|nr:hypothetical protein FOXG_18433 [Fusarium oxysporum f. sp. lycopersici 4287]EWY87961.1 hypothetical protein FOYG_09333 [Fusarium oxysporum NRRL 32931]EXK33752.1 hypothetical protein FOMG_10992 [Fusarium oxysporum f. sp. melonis 26406]KNA98595.1 hypothetical protein FOXG_18433 [Fusarium oxysporum f. sp. lycopersici 4287]
MITARQLSQRNDTLLRLHLGETLFIQWGSDKSKSFT